MEIIILALCLQLLQIGTVVEGGADFYSGRLTKKERKGTFADELLADTSLKAYRYGHFSSVFCNYLPAGKNHQSFQAEELCELPVGFLIQFKELEYLREKIALIDLLLSRQTILFSLLQKAEV
jgi:hypothetical protein